jgi:CRP-like cAMP-binding protein
MRDHHHDHLRKVPLFADFDRRDFDHMEPITTELALPAGHVILSKGATAHDMVIVLEGTLEVSRDGQHIADVGAGGFAGELALLTGERRNSDVVAKTDVVVLHIDGRSFEELLQRVPQLAVKMLPVVARRVTMTD